LRRARLARTLSPEELAMLYPEYPGDAPTTLAALSAIYRRLPLDSLYAALPPAVGPVYASNNWVVDGAHSLSGKPLVANDPHLAFGAPHGVLGQGRLRDPHRGQFLQHSRNPAHRNTYSIMQGMGGRHDPRPGPVCSCPILIGSQSGSRAPYRLAALGTPAHRHSIEGDFRLRLLGHVGGRRKLLAFLFQRAAVPSGSGRRSRSRDTTS